MFIYLREMETAAIDTGMPQESGRLVVTYNPKRNDFSYSILGMDITRQEATFYFSGFRDGKMARRRI
jgi:hypothetical protein